jgi:hypothetical protein
VTRPERPSVGRDGHHREERGDHESKRNETTPDDGWSVAGPRF